jgi:excinuclease ABC subunit A
MKDCPPATIVLRGAREHNLRSLDLDIPHNSLCVVTGVSGSGKSTLAFDVLFAEGQRRYLECMSAYARQFVEQLPKPELDFLAGLPPAVAIEQRVTRGGGKSTVATITEVAQYLRLLFARAATPRNPDTGNALSGASPEALLARVGKILATTPQRLSPVHLCASLVRDRKGHHRPLAEWARQHGHSMLRIDGKMVPLERFKPLDRYRTHTIELVLASFASGAPAPVPSTLALALQHGKGSCLLADARGGVIEWLSTHHTDPATGESFPAPDPKHFSWNSPQGWCPVCRGYGRAVERFAADKERTGGFMPPRDELSDELCPACLGARLNPFSRAATLPLRGGHTLSLPALLALTPHLLLDTLGRLDLDARGRAVAAALLPQIRARIQFLSHVGLDYLSLDRAADTLSGGEAQRIRLASQLGSNLSGVLYILDEPSIGLHPRDNERLLKSLRNLRDRGNTVLVVEHDEDTMRAADHVIDLGPRAGIHGGNIVCAGTLSQVRRHPGSLTAHYLRHPIAHPRRGAWRGVEGGGVRWLELFGARRHNLKDVDIRLPLARLNVVCGVSGAGKSTLIHDILAPALLARINGKRKSPAGEFFRRLNLPKKALRQVIHIDQDPIGKTPRSTPATYIGVYDRIRQHYATLPESRMRGHTAGYYSFNTAGGRCEVCSGAGRVKLEMSFLPETYVPCESCSGTRYGLSATEARWNGRSIVDVLAMNFEEAAAFFTFDRLLQEKLELMVRTGLGYLTLGQSSPTLSGGEAQRLKLVSELAKGLPQNPASTTTRRNLYILEEPTIGLHQADCERLIELLHALVEQGHTVIVIEHHLDIIAEADWVLELGPSGGDAGGELLYQGKLNGLALAETPTAPFIKRTLA